ncbi:1-phosphatidylinositol-4,5-bisphosphate phosphodiesterase delta-3 [Verticillium dahliae VdLs.17]|uniref:Phosphoinositide phospholipase C n=1 Tax=Verticillium dahliae (strain VdLs.17 / ATCC MYA-4575 / FGSC 10137) TaxID=498257 RepID=G2XH69_VERDV|nr:1-phosphatidylinositol-4,5-bisphosphate phosphodiesterase delta-3 [Verticillium dahliae VdLs.17]EGY19167.1 1-phosphatidylinositol-4,5-bisphosphate phosphodiesterase delta-3 [Verticillium dahliae VdLs.17]
MASILTSGMAKLNPFAARTHEDDTEDDGEEVSNGTLAGGGHGARDTALKHNLRVSHALKAYIVEHGILPASDVDLETEDVVGPALRDLIVRPHIRVPAEVTDRSYPLPDYFVSSSHNTYLLAHQLYGNSCATAYETALKAGSRCVEIDAWDNSDNKDEPKVTHGWTLTSNIPFRAVCEAIRDVHDEETEEARKHTEAGWQAAPIILSLENHCAAHGQRRLVEIMKEVLGDRLLSKAIREEGHREQEGSGEHVTLAELGSKIAVIVEYHYPDEKADSDSSSSSSDDEDEDADEKAARKVWHEKKHTAAPSAVIIPELSELGVYAQSVKPPNNSWFDPGGQFVGPHHHLINVSESGLGAHLPAQSTHIANHNARHLMRVYPKGTRISSRNLKPVPFWAVGAQICALNWQTFGAAMQINEALFSGTDGYVLKPPAIRSGGDGQLTDKHRRKKLRLHVAGASDVPLPDGHDLTSRPPKRKTAGYRQHKLGFLHKDDKNPPANDPVWDEVLEWEYDDNPLVFLRMLVKSDDSWASNPIFAVAAVRLLYATGEWNFIRMLDLKGQETKCALLVRIEIVDAKDGLGTFFGRD